MNLANLENFFNDKNFDLVINCATSGGNRLQQDDSNWVYENCLMVNNLLKNENKFKKIIHFGSGAELDRTQNINGDDLFQRFPTDPYGLSKSMIAKSFFYHSKFYNLRIYNVFNENELTTRMIRGNILKYLSGDDIEIHQNKYMDFFHIDDLAKVIEFYLSKSNLPKVIDCCYEKKHTLTDVANFINNLSDKKSKILLYDKNMGLSYCGSFRTIKSLNIKVSNLHDSIQKVYDNMIV
jgi:nucleoside-diphosphate-sugar epimerase